MDFSFIISTAIKASILLGAAFAAATLMRRASSSARHLVWLTALACLLALPLAQRLAPVWKPAAARAVRAEAAVTRTVITVTASASKWTGGQALFFLWLAGAGLLLLRTAAGHMRASSLTRSATRFGAAGELPVKLSSKIDVPIVCGLRHPVILLPAEAAGWSEARLGVVLRHEEAHAIRRDPVWQLVADLASALYWPLPWAWWAAARLKSEAELAADDGVLRSGERASDYAGHLIDLVRGLPGRERIPQGVIPMARLSHLEQRLRAMLSSECRRGPAGPRLALAVTLAAVCLLAPLAAFHLPALAAGPGIGGVVKDPSGAAVPGARVTLIFSGSDRREVTVSNPAGEFSISPLPDGDYEVQVAMPGFALLDLKGILLENGQSTPLLLVLQPGRVRESITVSSEGPKLKQPAPSADGTQRIRVGGNVQATKLIYRPKLAYPLDAKQDGVQGSVLLRAVISTSGDVINLQQINQLVDQRLVTAATEAVRQWRYEPTLLNGQPVEIVTEIEVNFTLTK
jgi:TonB family protein